MLLDRLDKILLPVNLAFGRTLKFAKDGLGVALLLRMKLLAAVEVAVVVVAVEAAGAVAKVPETPSTSVSGLPPLPAQLHPFAS